MDYEQKIKDEVARQIAALIPDEIRKQLATLSQPVKAEENRPKKKKKTDDLTGHLF